MSRQARQNGLTLIEVILAVSLSIIILGSSLAFYSQALRHRRVITAEVTILTSERQAMERITEDLRGALEYPFIKMGIKGETDSLEFICTTIPGPAVWSERSATDNPPPPEHDLHRVKFRLAMRDDPETDEERIAGLERVTRKIIVSEIMIEEEEYLFGDETEVEQEEEEIDPEDPTIKRTLLSSDIKHIAFRYWLDGDWVDTYDDSVLPAAVEVTLGKQPLDEGQSPEDYIHHVYRRVIYIPASGGSGAFKMESDGNSNSAGDPNSGGSL